VESSYVDPPCRLCVGFSISLRRRGRESLPQKSLGLLTRSRGSRAHGEDGRFRLPTTSNVLMSDAPSVVAPRKALRSCPTSLARLSALSRRCVQTARDSLCRSHPFSDVPCRSSSSPRALPRTRTLSPHASEDGGSRSLDLPRSVLARPCLRGRRSRLETSSVVSPSHALLVRGACYVLARPGVRSLRQSSSGSTFVAPAPSCRSRSLRTLFTRMSVLVRVNELEHFHPS